MPLRCKRGITIIFFLSFAAQYVSSIQNGCSGLINTTKKLCKGFCSESKWAPTNLTNQTKSIVSCVTLINVLYTSLTPPNQIVRLSGAHYYHAELFWGNKFLQLKNLSSDSLPVCLYPRLYDAGWGTTYMKNVPCYDFIERECAVTNCTQVTFEYIIW